MYNFANSEPNSDIDELVVAKKTNTMRAVAENKVEQFSSESNVEVRHKDETIGKFNCATKQSDITQVIKTPVSLVSSDTKSLMVTNCDTRCAQFPLIGTSTSIMIAMFEYEMKLQQARASADSDREIAKVRMTSERHKAEQERLRADIAAMKLRMFQFNV